MSGRWAWLALLALSAAAGWHFGRNLRKPEEGTKPSPRERITSVRSYHVGFQPGSPEALWMERVKAAKPPDFPGLMEQWHMLFIEADDYVEERPENALHFIFAFWLMKDADAFMETVTVHDYPYAGEAATVLVRAMPEKAVELISGPLRAGLDDSFVSSMATELAENHPALFLNMDPGGDMDLPPRGFDQPWEIAIAGLAKTDAVAAAEACLKSKPGVHASRFCDAMLSVAKAWKPDDPPLGGWVKGIADPEQRNIATHAWLYVLAGSDLRAALAELPVAKLKDDDGLSYDARHEILSRLAAADPTEALKVMKDTEAFFAKNGQDPFGGFSSEETDADPFVSLGQDHPAFGDDVANDGIRHAVLEGLRQSLPDAPGAFITALRGLHADGNDVDLTWQLRLEADLIRTKCPDWSADECVAAAGLWRKDPPAPDETVVESAWQKLADRAAALSPERTLSSLDSLPESCRALFLKEIILRLPDVVSDQDIALLSRLGARHWDERLGLTLGSKPEVYAEVIASLPGETTLEARKSFMTYWSRQDPEAAARWLDSLPDDETRKPAAAGLASAWAGYDGYAACSWAAALPAGPSRDAAAAALSASFTDHPEDSWQWANFISDPEARAKALVDLDSIWRYEAPEKYRAALDDARRVRGMPARGPAPPPDPSDPFAQ